MISLPARSLLVVAIAGLFSLGACIQARTDARELDQIVTALEARPGARLADVGAGDGEWSEALARHVGPSGHVYSTEVDEDELEDLRERLADRGLSNLTVVLGNQLETGLPTDCCDAILLRLVYHHFTQPEPMRAELRRALRPRGRLVVVEITPQRYWDEIEDVPDRGGHGILPETLIREMALDGWTALERHDDWGDDEDHYAVIFE